MKRVDIGFDVHVRRSPFGVWRLAFEALLGRIVRSRVEGGPLVSKFNGIHSLHDTNLRH
jgi:hypothetical protein